MASIKSLTVIADKWAANSSATEARNAYTAGINAPRAPWAESTVAADQARKDGLADADVRNAFVTGVNAAGNQKWRDRAATLGPTRFSQGVQVAKPAYNSGFSKYHTVISGVTLPPRGAKGSPENLERVRAITEALHTAKIT